MRSADLTNIKIEYKLINSDESMIKIASEFMSTPGTIQNINNGTVIKYYDKNLKYPLRSFR